MNIDGIQQAYQVNTTIAAKAAKSSAEQSSITNTTQQRNDIVDISPNGKFRSVLRQNMKIYATQYPQKPSAQRMMELREQYANGACPISGHAIAASMMNTVFGGEGVQ